MLEKDIEAYVRDHIKGRLIKFVSPGESGVPDRLLLLPNGVTYFLEFKKPGGVLSARQKLWAKRLYELGHNYKVIGDMDEARYFVQRINGGAYEV